MDVLFDEYDGGSYWGSNVHMDDVNTGNRDDDDDVDCVEVAGVGEGQSKETGKRKRHILGLRTTFACNLSLKTGTAVSCLFVSCSCLTRHELKFVSCSCLARVVFTRIEIRVVFVFAKFVSCKFVSDTNTRHDDTNCQVYLQVDQVVTYIFLLPKLFFVSHLPINFLKLFAYDPFGRDHRRVHASNDVFRSGGDRRRRLLYACGVSRLPVSTTSLIIASQLGFTAFFAFLLVKQKFTPYSITALYGLVLPMVEMTYNKAKQAITYTLVTNSGQKGHIRTILKS
ncbi:hypothetical protein LXL04_021763 [Taraxacum kok-saghyz]